MRSKATWLILFCVMSSSLVWSHGVQFSNERATDSRLAQLVEANIIAVHAFQILLARDSTKTDKNCFSSGSLSDTELKALSEHQASLLKLDLNEVKAWVNGRKSTFNPATDLEPILFRSDCS